MTPTAGPPRAVAFRCDGDDTLGAGHVGRCLPIAAAFAAQGWAPVFVGRYEGLAAWLLERAGLPVRPSAEDGGAPCGLDPAAWDAAVVDLYGADVDEVCALATRIGVLTLGEATRCPDAGLWVDYHLDRRAEPPTARVLP